MADIFISYKQVNRDRVAPLAKALEECGYTVWWDKHIHGGEEWLKRIITEVNSAKFLLGCWTKEAIDEQGFFVRSEDGINYLDIEHRTAGANKIIGLAMDVGVKPLAFADLQAINFQAWQAQNYDNAAFDELAKALITKMKTNYDPKVNASLNHNQTKFSSEFKSNTPLATRKRCVNIKVTSAIAIVVCFLTGAFIFNVSQSIMSNEVYDVSTESAPAVSVQPSESITIPLYDAFNIVTINEKLFFVNVRMANLRVSPNHNSVITTRVPFQTALIGRIRAEKRDNQGVNPESWLYVTNANDIGKGWINLRLVSEVKPNIPLDESSPQRLKNPND